jgi:polar amino acid transport system permease protein
MSTDSSSVQSPDAPPGARGQRPAPIAAVPIRHVGQWISAAVVLFLVGALIYTVAGNENIQWDVVGDFLFDGSVLRSVLVTIELTLLAMLIGIVGGVVLAVMRLSENPVLRTISWFYIWLFRGTPLLVQIVLWFNLALIFPTIGFGPISADTNDLIKPFVAALLGLGLNEAAYTAEIVRAGILSVDHGQAEAAHALGMTRGQTMQRIVLPQAMRVIIPPLGNETITMLKNTSLVAVIAANELLTRVQAIYANNFAVVELLLVASFWYLVLTSVATYAQSKLERRFARGSGGSARERTGQRILRNLRPGRVSGGAA